MSMWDEIFAAGRDGERRARAQKGRRARPDGSPARFAEAGERKCSECKSFVRRKYSRVISKCARTETRSAATDVRAGWVACSRFGAAEDEEGRP